jgi:hypothetical protein
VTRTLCVAAIERDYADRHSLQIDDEVAWTLPGNFRHRALEFVARSRAAEMGAHFWRAEQVDDSRTVPGLGLAQYEALGPDDAWWPRDGSRMCHALVLAAGLAVLLGEVC